jgi:serine/tyrosine/threonine adenylyltransferase
MSSLTNGDANGHPTWQGVSLADLPKSHTFTDNLPPDPAIPSPEASKEAPPQRLRVSRQVNSALFTWVAPEKNENPQLLAMSWKALRDLGLNEEEAKTEEFLALMSGNKIYEEHYPWGTRDSWSC